MRFKIKLLLMRRVGVDAAALDCALATEVERMRNQCALPLAFCRASAVQDEELKHIAAGAFDAGRPFDAMLEVVADSGDIGALIAACDGLGQRLSAVADAAASVALVGSEHVILAGDGPLLVLIANRRLPNYTHAGFLDYWLAYHGPFARANTPPDVGLYYRQFHTDEQATAALLRATGFGIADFDGAAECYYASADSVRKLMNNTATVDQATVDEKNFVDHERCVTSVFAITADSTSHRIT